MYHDDRKAANVRFIGRLAVVALISAATGCGSGLSPVSGTVTLDGKPLKGATVVFVPEEGGRANSVASTDEAGRYELEYAGGKSGAQPGRYKVLILLEVETEQGTIEKLPPRYNAESDLTAEVTPSGENVFNFDLESN